MNWHKLIAFCIWSLLAQVVFVPVAVVFRYDFDGDFWRSLFWVNAAVGGIIVGVFVFAILAALAQDLWEHEEL